LTRVFPNNWFSARNLMGRAATEPLRVDWVSGACLMTSRELFERMGGLDESFFLYWEDADYCGRAALAGRATTYLPEVSVKHEVGVSAFHDPGLAIREFHASAYRLHLKTASPAGRLAAPLVRAVLELRCRLCLVRARSVGASMAAAKATDQVRG
jgi:GT2 family glycosyltransferase